MPLRRFAPAVILAGLVIAGMAVGAYASAPPPQVVVDSAPRMPLPSEPPAEPPLRARTAVLVSGGAVVAALLALVAFVKRRERSAPMRADDSLPAYLGPAPANPRERAVAAGPVSRI